MKSLTRSIISLVCVALIITGVVWIQEPVVVYGQDWSWSNTTTTWTVPYTGWYTLEVGGGQGGLCYSDCTGINGTADGGYGAVISGEFYLTGGTVLNIVAGAPGSNNTCPQSHEHDNYDEDGGTGGQSYIKSGNNIIIYAHGGKGGNVQCDNETDEDGGTDGDAYWHGDHATTSGYSSLFTSKNITKSNAKYYWYGYSSSTVSGLDNAVMSNIVNYGGTPHNCIIGGNGRQNVLHDGVWRNHLQTGSDDEDNRPAGSGWRWGDEGSQSEEDRWFRWVPLSPFGLPKWASGWWDTQTSDFYAQVNSHTAKSGYVKISSNIAVITCDKQGGTGGTDIFYEQPYQGFVLDPNNSETITSILVPSREGYFFDGYYTSTINGIQIIDNTGNIVVSNSYFTSDSTIYAVWIPITYNVDVHNNKPSDATSNVVNVK